VYVETAVYLNCYVNRNANDTYFWHPMCPYLWPEQQHHHCVHTIYTCTPIKLALTYLLKLTQIALIEMGPFDCLPGPPGLGILVP
jgi:hypothetical protein